VGIRFRRRRLGVHVDALANSVQQSFKVYLGRLVLIEVPDERAGI
jgi:hypothetical protein